MRKNKHNKRFYIRRRNLFEERGEVVAGYEILDRMQYGLDPDLDVVIGNNPVSPEPYVCWVGTNGDYNWGKYFKTYQQAEREMKKRAKGR